MNWSQASAMIQSFYEHDEDRFRRTALQIAADAAQKGHHRVSEAIRSDVEKASNKRGSMGEIKNLQTGVGLDGLLFESMPELKIDGMVLADGVAKALCRVIAEARGAQKLAKYGLGNRRKLLLVGPPGTGKTMAAVSLAGELGWPLYHVRLDAMISRYLGETAPKLRLIFDSMRTRRGVYLFDEFDSIGASRTSDDVGEMRRVLNSFLQFIVDDASESLIVATTNQPGVLDSALARRFDDVIEYVIPDHGMALEVMRRFLMPFDSSRLDLAAIAEAASGLSHAEIVSACSDAAKAMVLDDMCTLQADKLSMAIRSKSMAKSVIGAVAK